MNAQTLKRESERTRTLVFDVLWLVSFMTTWGLLIVLWHTWWAIALVPAFAIMLAGIGEFLHQATHRNLFLRSDLWNDLFGTIAAAIVGIDHKTYRAFHLRHHRVVNTKNDTEKAIYSFPEYVERVKGWSEFSSWHKIQILFGVAISFANAIGSVLEGGSSLVRILRWGIPLAIAAIGFLQGFTSLIPVMLIVTWYLPLCLFLFIDLLLAQSRHYRTPLKGDVDRVSPSEQYEISWNLKVPQVVELMLMRRNLHAEHHEYPALHWSVARDKEIGRTLPLGEYLRSWWAYGPRVL